MYRHRLIKRALKLIENDDCRYVCVALLAAWKRDPLSLWGRLFGAQHRAAGHWVRARINHFPTVEDYLGAKHHSAGWGYPGILEDVDPRCKQFRIEMLKEMLVAAKN